MCAACSYRTSVTAGTIFDRTRTPLTVWFTACWLFATAKDGISALSLQRSLEIGSYQTAWAMLGPAGRPGGGGRDLYRRGGAGASGRGRSRRPRQRNAGIRRAWSGHQRTARGGPLTWATPVKWRPPNGHYVAGERGIMITQIVLLTSVELPRGMCPVAGRDAERRQEGSHRFPGRGPFLDVGKMAAVLEEHELGAADVGGELLGAHGRVPRAEAQGPSWPMSSE